MPGLQIAGQIAVGADQAGAAHHAVLLAERLALIVCSAVAHLRPVVFWWRQLDVLIRGELRKTHSLVIQQNLRISYKCLR
jgi:hypothetical protein